MTGDLGEHDGGGLKIAAMIARRIVERYPPGHTGKRGLVR
jgi:hypothetical protein